MGDNPQIEDFLKDFCHEERLEKEEGSLAAQLTKRQQVERTLAKNALHNFAVFLTTVHHSEGGLEKKPEPTPLDIPPPPIPADQVNGLLEVKTLNKAPQVGVQMITPAPLPKQQPYASHPRQQPIIGPLERPIIRPPEQSMTGPLTRTAPPPLRRLAPPKPPLPHPNQHFRPKISLFLRAKPPICPPSINTSTDIIKPVKPLKKTKDIKPVTRKTQRRRTIATPDILVPQRSAANTKKRKATAISKPPSRTGPCSVLESDIAAVKRLKKQKG